MRWPLRNQILIRMMLLLLITIAAVTYANISALINNNNAREKERVEKIAQLLKDTRFPLTTTVLENMRSLSGAEFAVVNAENEILSQTDNSPSNERSSIFKKASDHADELVGYGIIQIGKNEFAHTVLETFPGQVRNHNTASVHVFLPRQSDRMIWWQSSKSPLLIASLILPVVLIVSLALANQVTRPLARLKNQVQQIAKGNLASVTPSSGNDEITDLHKSINEMAEKLQDHENQLRLNERLRTLIQFGNGIAHHLRNAATGCKMAIQLLAAEKPVGNNENYQVASRQLDLMNNYIKKFLMISKTSESHEIETENIDLSATLSDVLFLLQPSAKHLNVTVQVDMQLADACVRMSRDDAEQLMINLITNAISAASEKATKNPSISALVRIRLFRNEHQRIVFSVIDNGAGPPEGIVKELFQPFVSGTKEGTGLGLALVREIAERVNGSVEWQRLDDQTEFNFAFAETMDEHSTCQTS